MFSTRGTRWILSGGRLKKKKSEKERERERKKRTDKSHTRKRGATGKREESANAVRHSELLILPDECMFKGLPARVIDGFCRETDRIQ